MRHGAPFLVLALLTSFATSPAAPSAAEAPKKLEQFVVVLVDGTRVATRGRAEIVEDQVLFTDASGARRIIPVAKVDLPKTRAANRPPVTIYATTWCGQCKSLRRYLDSRGVEATYINTNTLPEAEKQAAFREMERLLGSEHIRVPMTVVGDKLLVGFDRAKVDALVGLTPPAGAVR
ncbi:MAG: glutaredoxin family protein [Acidobacteriota bacterium]